MGNYTIKAHPTKYREIVFRSRLEATWAAYFDLCEIEWEYEPFDLEGWVPDFLLKHGRHEILVEVKPVADPMQDSSEYAKATAYRDKAWILLLGRSPDLSTPGILMDHPEMFKFKEGDEDPWWDFHCRISPVNTLQVWAEATNTTRWKGPADPEKRDYKVMGGKIVLSPNHPYMQYARPSVSKIGDLWRCWWRDFDTTKQDRDFSDEESAKQYSEKIFQNARIIDLEYISSSEFELANKSWRQLS